MLQVNELNLNNNHISYLARPGREDTFTVVFVHGFPFKKEMWNGQLLALPLECSGIAYDVRGFGLSTTEHYFFSMDLFADDLIGFIQSGQLRNVILCGLSMGGYIALRAFEKQPDLFKGLILCDTNSSADADENKTGRFKSISKIISGEKEAFADEFLKKVLSKRTLATKPETTAFTKNMILSVGENTLCATQLALASRTDTTAFLKEIKVPTLVIRGRDDLLMKPEQTEVLRSNLPDCTYAEIPDAAHLPNLENSEAFNFRLNSFLQDRFLG